jgi:hypothetical protein
MRATADHGMTREPRLGIDIGRVIVAGDGIPDATDTFEASKPGRDHDTAFFEGDEAAMLATPEVPDALESIAALVSIFGGRVWLVSKCGPRVEARTLRWLAGHDFYARTGVPRQHVRFCRARAEKRLHCAELGLTHFVDDRPDVHAAIHDIVEHQYLFGPQSAPAPIYTIPIDTWPALRRLIELTLRQ